MNEEKVETMNGLLYINKPKDQTSFDVVAKIRRAYGIKSVGHTGTLDPQATGVLIVMLGKACKANPYLVHDTKEYIAGLRLGKKYDTGDIWGNVIEEKPIPSIDKTQVLEVIHSFLGKRMQVPPMYSAVKINGKKLYEYARQNQTVEVQPRAIEIMEIELLEMSDELLFRVSCSAGTYIRTLMEEIAEQLGTVGAMCSLVRTKAGSVSLERCLSLEEVLTNCPAPFNVLDGLKERYPVISIESDQLERNIKDGKKIKLNCDDEIIVAQRNNQAIAVLEKRQDVYCSKRGLW